jgi:hypothetical protein
VKNNVFSYSREFSGKHSFTLHPSLDPYGQKHRQRNTLILVGLATLMGSSRYILKNNETFLNLSVAIVSQKYQEFSMQVENCE